MPLLLKTVSASQGSRWVGDAFRLFARRPMGFMLLSLSFFVAAMLMRQLPVFFAPLPLMAMPLLSLGFMVAAQSALLKGKVGPAQFVEPLRGDPVRRRSLITLCVGYGLALLLIVLLVDAISGQAWGRMQALIPKGEAAQAEVEAIMSETRVRTATLLGLVLSALLSVPYWHAPALVHWGAHGAKQALFSSTVAVWRSKGAFALYMATWMGVLLGVTLTAATLMQLVGLEAWIPLLSLPLGLLFSAVFYISVLFTFNDSFGGAIPPVLAPETPEVPPVPPQPPAPPAPPAAP